MLLSGGSSGNPSIELRGSTCSPYIDFVENTNLDYSTRLLSQAGTLNLQYGGPPTVNYAQLTPVLIEALKEQQAQIEALKAQNAAAHTELQTVKAQAATDKAQATATLERGPAAAAGSRQWPSPALVRGAAPGQVYGGTHRPRLSAQPLGSGRLGCHRALSTELAKSSGNSNANDVTSLQRFISLPAEGAS